MICQIWGGSPRCHWGGSTPLCCPASPPTHHLSPFLRTRAIQRPLLTFELRVLIGCVRCCKGDSSLSLPVYPSAPSSLVVVVLCSCSPGLSCGVLVLVLISQCGQVQTNLPVSSCHRQHRSWLDVKKVWKKSWWQEDDLDLGMMNTCINGRSQCTLPLYRLCKVLLIYCLCK